MLREKYPDLQYDEQLSCICIPNYPLPANRYNKEQTMLFFVIPKAYPNTGPDNFFVDGDLRLKDGALPPGLNVGSDSSSGVSPIPGNWSWFSWHPSSWQPAADIEKGDNLVTFLRSINICLEGKEAS